MVGQSGLHYRGNTKGTMNSAEIVVEKIKGNGGFEIVQFLRKAIGQTREPTHLHPHRKVLPLVIAGRNLPRVGFALYGRGDCCDYVNRRVPLPVRAPFPFLPVELYELSIVHVCAESIFDGQQVGLV